MPLTPPMGGPGGNVVHWEALVAGLEGVTDRGSASAKRLGFRVWGVGFRVDGSGFKVWG